MRALVIAVVAAALLTVAASPTANADPTDTSGGATTVAVPTVAAAREQLATATASHQAAVTEVADSADDVEAATTAVAELDAKIDALSNEHADELDSYEQARTVTTNLAVQTYIGGGPDQVMTSALLNADVHDLAAAQSTIVATSTVFAERAERHQQAADRLTAPLRKLADDAAAARATLAAAETRHRDLVAGETAAAAAVADAETQLAAAVTAAADSTGGGTGPTGISTRAMSAYKNAATIVAATRGGCQVPWWAIAAIGRVESGHGTYRGASVQPDGTVTPHIIGPQLNGGAFAAIGDTDGGALDGDTEWDRAVGPMQFIPSTWKGYAVDGNGDGTADPHNIFDAAVATGLYLCRGARGAPLDSVDGMSAGAYSYNRSRAYVAKVLDGARSYAISDGRGPGVYAAIGASGDWSTLASQTVRVDATPRPAQGSADAAIAARATIPAGSTIAIVGGPDEPASTVIDAASRIADNMLDRHIVAILTSPGPHTMPPVAANLTVIDLSTVGPAGVATAIGALGPG